MRVDLHIKFDGEQPALKEHRLSISAFAEALQLLHKALQRTATAIDTGTDDAGYGERGGRFSRAAEGLDLELTAVGKGSAICKLRCAQRAQQLEMEHSSLARGAVEKLLIDIEAESRGTMASSVARKFLNALPEGVSQVYTAFQDGKPFKTVSVNTLDLPESPREMPRVVRVSGELHGIVFQDGKEQISIVCDGKRRSFLASKPQVDRALGLREGTIWITALDRCDGKPSVLRVDADPPPVGGSDSSRLDSIARDWRGVLERLAK